MRSSGIKSTIEYPWLSPQPDCACCRPQPDCMRPHSKDKANYPGQLWGFLDVAKCNDPRVVDCSGIRRLLHLILVVFVVRQESGALVACPNWLQRAEHGKSCLDSPLDAAFLAVFDDQLLLALRRGLQPSCGLRPCPKIPGARRMPRRGADIGSGSAPPNLRTNRKYSWNPFPLLFPLPFTP